MWNEKVQCKQMDEHRNYNFRNEFASGGASHPESILLASEFHLSIVTCFLSELRDYFQGHMLWMEFLMQRKTSCIRHIFLISTATFPPPGERTHIAKIQKPEPSQIDTNFKQSLLVPFDVSGPLGGTCWVPGSRNNCLASSDRGLQLYLFILTILVAEPRESGEKEEYLRKNKLYPATYCVSICMYVYNRGLLF